MRKRTLTETGGEGGCSCYVILLGSMRQCVIRHSACHKAKATHFVQGFKKHSWLVPLAYLLDFDTRGGQHFPFSDVGYEHRVRVHVKVSDPPKDLSILQ